MMSGQPFLIERLRSMLFGFAPRRVFRDYLVLILLIMFILLSIAWTIDLADHFEAVRAKATEQERPLMAVLAPYLGYRGIDIVTRLLTMACFFGAFMGAISRRLKLETVILNAAGMSPLRSAAGVLWLGLVLGVGQNMMESHWRPAAIWAQVELGVGSYAKRYARRWVSQPNWLFSDDVALRGYVHRTADPEMGDVMVFTSIQNERLDRVYHAETITPGDAQFEWHLKGVTSWNFDKVDGTLVDDLTLTIEIIPEMLTYLNVAKFNLPPKDLDAFKAVPSNVRGPEVNTAIWRRRTAWLMPGAFMILGISLANRGFDGRRANIPRLIGLAAFGYIIVVSVKVFWALGESGALSAPLATTAGVALALAASLIVSWRHL